MNKPRISIIVAMDSKRGIGKNNGLMWHIPGELARFKQITSGHPIIMGRKTYESIGRPLPDRTNIVITGNIEEFSLRHSRGGGNPDPRFHENDNKLIIINSLEEAVKKAQKAPGAEEIFIIGGGQIYSQALPITDRLYLTLVEGDFGADTFFPNYSEFKKVVSEEKNHAGNYRYQFLVLEKEKYP